MKYIKGITLFTTGAIASSVLVFYILINRGGFSASSVSVEVINKSDYEISKILLTHGNVKIHFNGLEVGRSTNIPFHIRGEGLYSLHVYLENGSVHSREAYVESGYRKKDIITNKGIESKIVSLY